MCLEFLHRAAVWYAAVWPAVAASAVVLGLCAVLTYERNQVWASPLSLWHDTAEKSPNKVRLRFQLAFAYYDLGRCAEAAVQYEKPRCWKRRATSCWSTGPWRSIAWAAPATP